MNKLILGDCLSALPKIADESVNLVLTDPPYLVNYQDRSGRSMVKSGICCKFSSNQLMA